jgi:hypothetical protein
LLAIATLQDLRVIPSPAPLGRLCRGAGRCPLAPTPSWASVGGAELDLVVERGARKIGIEIKFSSTPKPTRGFWQALDDLQIDRAYVVAPVARRYPLADRVEVVPLAEATTLFI